MKGTIPSSPTVRSQCFPWGWRFKTSRSSPRWASSSCFLPSRFPDPTILLWLYLRLYCSDVLLLWYAVLTRVRCRGLFYVSLPCPGVHPHGSRVVAHLQPLCWGFFSSFEVTWSGVRLVLNVSFVFCGFTLRLSWSSCADSMAGCLRETRESYLGYAVHALQSSSIFLRY